MLEVRGFRLHSAPTLENNVEDTETIIMFNDEVLEFRDIRGHGMRNLAACKMSGKPDSVPAAVRLK